MQKRLIFIILVSRVVLETPGNKKKVMLDVE